MRKYKCHKIVEAFKISEVSEPIKQLDELSRPQEICLLFHEHGGVLAQVSRDWADAHDPKVGGYFVRYEDGYESYSPAKAFEEGYKEITAEQILYDLRPEQMTATEIGKFEGKTTSFSLGNSQQVTTDHLVHLIEHSGHCDVLNFALGELEKRCSPMIVKTFDTKDLGRNLKVGLENVDGKTVVKMEAVDGMGNPIKSKSAE